MNYLAHGLAKHVSEFSQALAKRRSQAPMNPIDPEPNRERSTRHGLFAGQADVSGNPACATSRLPGATFVGWMK